MKKLMALLLTAVMTLSMGVTAFGAKAYESDAKVSLNGEGSLYLQAYTIDGYTYFGLREVCAALQETVNEFDLNWNSGNKTTIINRKTQGIPILSMSYSISYGEIKATPVDVNIQVDDQMVTMKAYNINNYNYFKLRDMADLIGFEVGWNDGTKTINIISPYGSPTSTDIHVQTEVKKSVKTDVERVENEDTLQIIPAGEADSVVRNQAVMIRSKEDVTLVMKNHIFNDCVSVILNDDDKPVVFEGCTFNDDIHVNGDYTLGKNLIFKDCDCNGDIVQIPKWK